jgi:DNA-binding transcriptional regulator YiaG
MNVYKKLGIAAQWARDMMHTAIEQGHGRQHSVAVDSSHDRTTRLHTILSAARAIRRMRMEARLSQQEFASLLGVSVAAITTIEVGEADCLSTLQMCDQASAMLGRRVTSA